MRSAILVVCLLLGVGAPAAAAVSIGFNVGVYPELVPVPGYPVYYAPQLESNYFFYDGLYWVYAQDGWYSSPWYNGPWDPVGPEFMPLFVLRVPVFYYRQPPAYFRSWNPQDSPRWGEHWGHDWEQRRSGWDHWDRASAPMRAPLPEYQRGYSGDHYPRAAQQQTLQNQNYRYEPRDDSVRQQYKQSPEQHAVSQPRMPPAGNPQGGTSPGNANPSHGSTAPAGDAVPVRQEPRISSNGKHTDVAQPRSPEHAAFPAPNNPGAERKDGQHEQEKSSARESQPGPPPHPSQPAQSQDKEERSTRSQ
jgi:hypothetical protein